MDGYGVVQLLGLGVFLVAVVGRTLTVRRRTGRSPIRLGRHGAEGVARTAALLLVMNLWIAETLRSILRPHVRPLPPVAYLALVDWVPLRALGAALMALGIVILCLALHRLGASWRLGIDPDRPGPLVTEGIYSISRHPVYLFFDLFLGGSFLIHGTPTFLGLALVMAALLHGQILHEERFLRRVYPEAYARYSAVTQRYLTVALRGPRVRRVVEAESETP